MLARTEINEGALKNFKEFLEIYNQMTELCFSRCVHSLHSSRLTQAEMDCSDLCAAKHMNFNHKVLGSFMTEQPRITEQRIADATKRLEQGQ